MKSKKNSEKEGNYFSTYLVEKAGTRLMERNSSNNLRDRISGMTIPDKSNAEIEQAFRTAFDKTHRH